MKKLKEINLSVDTSRYASPHVKGKQPYFSGYGGGMNDSAASSYSSYMNSKKYEHEDEPIDEEEDIMPENILRYRVRKEKGYDLSETLKAVNESYEFLDIAGSALKYGNRAVKSGIKSTVLGIPVVDLIAGSLYLTSGILSFKEISDVIIEKIAVEENTFASAMVSESEESWNTILRSIDNLDESKREELEDDFEDLLHNIKSLLTTIIQSLDTAILSAAGFVVPPSIVALVGTGNIATAIGGFVTDMVPWERFVLQATGKFAEVIEYAFDTFLGGAKNNEKVSEAIEGAGPIFMSLCLHPVRSLRRLGQFYEVIETGVSPAATVVTGTVDHLSDPTNLEPLIDKAIDSFLSETSYYDYGIDEDDENDSEDQIDEFSGSAAIGGGPATPLGTGPDGKRETSAKRKERERKANIYAESLRNFQSWQHKTCGRTK